MAFTSKFRRSLKLPINRPYEMSGNFTSASTPVLTGCQDLTVTKNGTGDYTLTFNSSVNAVQSICIEAVLAAGGVRNHSIKTVSTSAIEVLFFNSSDAAADPDSAYFRIVVSEG